MVRKFLALTEIPLWRDWNEEVAAMYAIFETGGKQYKAEKGDIVHIEKLDADVGKTVSFDVLVVADGADITIGTPYVKGAKVKAKIDEHGKDKKVIVYKFKPKRKYRKKQGHRQPYTRVTVTGITLAKDKADATAEPKAAAKTTAAKTTTAKKPAAKTTAAKTTTAKAPVAPEIMPGRPPHMAATNPTINAEYRPTKGSTPATKEKATASGISASETVRPERISLLRLFLVL